MIMRKTETETERKRERRDREREEGEGRGTERHKGKEIEKCHRNGDRDSHKLTSFHQIVLLISLYHVQCRYHISFINSRPTGYVNISSFMIVVIIIVGLPL